MQRSLEELYFDNPWGGKKFAKVRTKKGDERKFTI